jgi:hypothetical protein
MDFDPRDDDTRDDERGAKTPSQRARGTSSALYRERAEAAGAPGRTRARSR